MNCETCGWLDKTLKHAKLNGWYNYGCRARESCYTVGDMRTDKELRWQGCSGWTEKTRHEQVSLFGG